METGEFLLRLLALYAFAVLAVILFAFVSELKVLRGEKKYHHTKGALTFLWDERTNNWLVGILFAVSLVNVLIILQMDHCLPATKNGVNVLIGTIFFCLGGGFTLKPLAVIIGRGLAKIMYAIVKKKTLFEED